ncbi:MAG: hypothetical protein LKJ76_01955 [Lachnospiraceae bacterium]|jgi:superfamily II helicase|nr:hypothetical protein [Lachnospiraceae bacterium]
MKMLKKGQYGYISNRRVWKILLLVVLLAADLAMFETARAYFGTVKNLFSIFAVLICLPIAKSAVSMIMFLKARGCSEGAHEQIEKHIGELEGDYDLYMTSYTRDFQISHITAACHNVAAFSETDRGDGKAGEEHIRKMLEQNGMKGYEVKIFYNLHKYLERLDSLNQLSKAAGKEDLTKEFDLFRSISI